MFINKEFRYPDFNSRLSKCDLRIKTVGETNIVIFTELNDNPGASVTNCAEILVSLVCNLFQISPGNSIFIEHYIREDNTNSYDEILLSEGSHKVKWRRMKTSEVMEYLHDAREGLPEEWRKTYY